MNKLILTSVLTFASWATLQPALAQATCENVVIESILYNAVYPDVIDVRAYYDGTDCMTNPSFILFDEAGDTLGIEIVNFFCVGFGMAQTHSMTVHEDVVVPTGSFNARLELFSGFGDTLMCSWELNYLVLCPPAGCQEAEIYITNTGELEAFEAYWWITNEDGSIQLDAGSFMVGDDVPTHFASTCLVPGTYQLGFSPFSPIDDEYVIGITPDYQQSGGFNTYVDDSESPWDLNFTWYVACADGTNSIAELAKDPLLITTAGSLLSIVDPEAKQLGQVQLFSADGRLVRSLRVEGDRTEVDLSALAPGLHVVRIIRMNGSTTSRSIILP